MSIIFSLFASLIIINLLSVSCATGNIHSKIFEKMKNEPTKELFKMFHKLNNKQYDLNSKESVEKYKIFKANLKKIQEHNANPNRSYDLGVTEYADWSEEQWRNRYGGRPELINKNGSKISPFGSEYQTQFNPIDWRLRGVNGPVYKDSEYTCQNTYALAHTYTIEAYHFIQTGVWKDFSPQNLIDCTTWDCTGFSNVEWDINYKFLYENGLYENRDYPHTGLKGTCRTDVLMNAKKYAPNVWEFPYKGNYDTKTIYQALQRGPLFFCQNDSVTYLYTGGIIDNYADSPLCGFNNCYYGGAMLLGYGIDSQTNQEYWIAKSTLGSSWGEEGYFRFARNDEKQNLGINCLYLRPSNEY